MRRSTNSSGTTLTVYAFGLEEHVYSSSGSNQGNTYYYTLAGQLLGKSDGASTTFFQTDRLGSVVANWSNTAGSAALRGNQVYGPYGKQRYNQGTHGTPIGFTGQYADSVTGLDYYNARYYDPVAGVFLSADTVQGNAGGMDPFAYVDGNPETYTDPSGQRVVPDGGGGGGSYVPPPPPQNQCDWWCWAQQQWHNFDNNVVHPVEHFVAQQAQELIPPVASHIPILIPLLIGAAAAATIGSAAYAIWQFTHTDPNWKDVAAGGAHSRWVWDKQDYPGDRPHPGIVTSKSHVLSRHVNISNTVLKRRAQDIGEATKFYDQNAAQYAVDYALNHMTRAQQIQLLLMRGSPFSRFGATLTLTGTSDRPLGYGYRKGTLTPFNNLTNYRVVIGIDFKTGQPYLITAYLTLP